MPGGAGRMGTGNSKSQLCTDWGGHQRGTPEQEVRVLSSDLKQRISSKVSIEDPQCQPLLCLLVSRGQGQTRHQLVILLPGGFQVGGEEGRGERLAL